MSPQNPNLHGNLTGTARPRLAEATYKPSRQPYAPKSLKDEGKTLWRQLASLLENELDDADLSALEMLCRSWGMYKQAAAAYELDPVVAGSRGNFVASPWYGIMNTEAERCRKLFNAFKLTPEARTKLGALQQENSVDKELAQLLAGK